MSMLRRHIRIRIEILKGMRSTFLWNCWNGKCRTYLVAMIRLEIRRFGGNPSRPFKRLKRNWKL